ncbi:hypothetical protein [Kitasatospora sp. NPDC056181]|uniref:hypothetical protein n=1 Tax=Kitasatospora sp. NPDC056181 TaxID=3345737 RepID=UPI0035E114FB
MADQQGGYTVQPDALDGTTGTRHNVATDLAPANPTYAAQACGMSTAFGEYGADQAWASFDSNWSQEPHVTPRAVDDLVQKVSTTGSNHRAADAEVAASMTPGRAA